ncbi:hypothetical protein GE118_04110 [Mycoplasma sp. NEAQ87857]|uniref:hypothetical protein n=1 Tax=Mycoplasma sp. NEAQ87857 TaxID=2683967 RepID=UPI001318AC0E|nr:hypothetical protein [Mycoplasma sp. NEAQ87857]QGZ97960.1 hypothetical protein GE118_04110 [Mycoplasma sp. NEAQ87857]
MKKSNKIILISSSLLVPAAIGATVFGVNKYKHNQELNRLKNSYFNKISELSSLNNDEIKQVKNKISSLDNMKEIETVFNEIKHRDEKSKDLLSEVKKLNTDFLTNEPIFKFASSDEQEVLIKQLKAVEAHYEKDKLITNLATNDLENIKTNLMHKFNSLSGVNNLNNMKQNIDNLMNLDQECKENIKQSLVSFSSLEQLQDFKEKLNIKNHQTLSLVQQMHLSHDLINEATNSDLLENPEFVELKNNINDLNQDFKNDKLTNIDLDLEAKTNELEKLNQKADLLVKWANKLTEQLANITITVDNNNLFDDEHLSLNANVDFPSDLTISSIQWFINQNPIANANQKSIVINSNQFNFKESNVIYVQVNGTFDNLDFTNKASRKLVIGYNPWSNVNKDKYYAKVNQIDNFDVLTKQYINNEIDQTNSLNETLEVIEKAKNLSNLIKEIQAYIKDTNSNQIKNIKYASTTIKNNYLIKVNEFNTLFNDQQLYKLASYKDINLSSLFDEIKLRTNNLDGDNNSRIVSGLINDLSALDQSIKQQFIDQLESTSNYDGLYEIKNNADTLQNQAITLLNTINELKNVNQRLNEWEQQESNIKLDETIKNNLNTKLTEASNLFNDNVLNNNSTDLVQLNNELNQLITSVKTHITNVDELNNLLPNLTPIASNNGIFNEAFNDIDITIPSVNDLNLTNVEWSIDDQIENDNSITLNDLNVLNDKLILAKVSGTYKGIEFTNRAIHPITIAKPIWANYNKDNYYLEIDQLQYLSDALKTQIKQQFTNAETKNDALEILEKYKGINQKLSDIFDWINNFNNTKSQDVKFKYSNESHINDLTSAIDEFINLLVENKLNNEIEIDKLNEAFNNIETKYDALNGDDNLNNVKQDLKTALNHFGPTPLENELNNLTNTNDLSELNAKAHELKAKNQELNEVLEFLNINLVNKLTELNNYEALEDKLFSLSDEITTINNLKQEILSLFDNSRIIDINSEYNPKLEQIKETITSAKSKIKDFNDLKEILTNTLLNATNGGYLPDENTPVVVHLDNIENVTINNYNFYVDGIEKAKDQNGSISISLSDFENTPENQDSKNVTVKVTGTYKWINFENNNWIPAIEVYKPTPITEEQLNEELAKFDALTNLEAAVINKFKEDARNCKYLGQVKAIFKAANAINTKAGDLAEKLKLYLEHEGAIEDYKFAKSADQINLKNVANRIASDEYSYYKIKDTNITLERLTQAQRELNEVINQLQGVAYKNNLIQKINSYSTMSTNIKNQLINGIDAKATDYDTLMSLGNLYDQYDQALATNLPLLVEQLNLSEPVNTKIDSFINQDLGFELNKTVINDFKANRQEISNIIARTSNNLNTITTIADLYEKFRNQVTSLDRFADDAILVKEALAHSNIYTDNQGYLLSADAKYKLGLNIDSKVNIKTMRWLAGDNEVYGATHKVNDIDPFVVDQDKEVKLIISGFINDVTFENYEVKNTVTLHHHNPLKDVELNASSKTLAPTGVDLSLTHTESLSNVTYKWYRYNDLLDNNTNSLHINSVGTYFVKIVNDQNIEWNTNSIDISSLPLVNDSEKFKAIESKEVGFLNGFIQDLGYHPRTANHEVYETPLTKKYGSDFKYPAWNYDYKAGRDHPNSYLMHNGVRVNVANEVREEKVPDRNNYYRDAGFIKDEIRNNRLKKHPAAAGFYQKQIPDTAQSLTRRIGISTTYLGMHTTGIYAAPGEVVEIEFSEETYKLLKARGNIPFTFIINQNYWDNHEFGNTGMVSKRYPKVRSEFNYSLSEIDEHHRIKIGSPFGGPINVKINGSLYTPNGDIATLDMTIHNGLEMLGYFDGITTKEQWDQQVAKVKSGQIVAPELAINTNYSAILAPWTSDTQVAYVNFDDLVYPKDVIQKWNSFYEGSFMWNEFKSNRIALNYADDIWGGAAAWGGGDQLYAPISWASKYLRGQRDFGTEDWGNYHEINHNFQHHQDPFNIKDHGWTNIPSVLNLSYINDTTRFRNLANTTGQWEGGWAGLANEFSSSKGGHGWYALYSSMIYMLGQNRFVDWVKNSDWNGKHTNGSRSNAFETIEYLSEFTKLDFGYMLQSHNWNNNLYELVADLSDKYVKEIQKNIDQINLLQGIVARFTKELEAKPNDANLQAKVRRYNEQLQGFRDQNEGYKNKLDELVKKLAKVKEINKKYPGIDIVGNVYAAGDYFYHSDKQKFTYNGDHQAAFQVAAGKPYVFDFEKGIRSINPNFQWSELKFSKNSKFNGTLALDPNNPKRLIYTANNNFLDQIDEFDVEIIPSNFHNKPENYVPGYKWKIKVRNVVNAPVMTYYGVIPNEVINTLGRNEDRITNLVNKLDDLTANGTISGIEFPMELNPRYTGYLDKEHTLVSYKFKFKPNKSGKLKFVGNVDDWYALYINGELQNKGTSTGDRDYSNFKDFDENTYYDVVLYAYNDGGKGHFDINYVYEGEDTKYSVLNQSLSSYINNVTTDDAKLKEFLTDDKYKYQRRFKDRVNKDPKEIQRYIQNLQLDQSTARFTTSHSSLNGNTGAIQVTKPGNNRFEVWNTKEATFNWYFTKPQVISGYSFNFWGNHRDYAPTKAQIWTILDNGTKLMLYDGRAQQWRYMFDKSYKVNNIHVRAWHENKGTGFVLAKVNFFTTAKQNYIVGINNPEIKYYGSWDFVKNAPDVANSNVNNLSAVTSTANDYLEYKFKGSSINLYGKAVPSNNTTFDVYIDGELVASDISNANNWEVNNKLLFSYSLDSDNDTDHFIRIVNKTNNKLTVQYFTEYREEE